MTRIGIILGSTRPGRVGETVAHWVREVAQTRTDAEFELIDLADHPLPLLDEGMLPAYHRYENDHTIEWSERIDAFDGYVFVTPEYNHSMPGVLKNAIDYLYLEWNNKAAAFVGYGSVGGARAIEQLRLVAGQLLLATVRTSVNLSLATDFENYTVLMPEERQVAAVHSMLDELVAWTQALAPLRAGSASPATTTDDEDAAA